MRTTHDEVVVLDGSTDEPREIIGGKAWSIQRMLQLGLPVPPAFVLTTAAWRRFNAEGSIPDEVWSRMPDAVAGLERATGRTFGSGKRPLLLSVRSGAAISMPGMMDTILNLGLTDEVERALADETADAAYAADTRRRFVDQFTRIVGEPPPLDPVEQLRLAVTSVFRSWDSTRAVDYRDRGGIDHDAGTAVTVQAMVFGNLDERSGTGVMFTRNPLNGDPEPYGEWLSCGQGEDVVSGAADALPLATLGDILPEVHDALLEHARHLEATLGDVQDIEFTIESGTLWLLQTRGAKRTMLATARHAVQLERAGIIRREEALTLLEGMDLRDLQEVVEQERAGEPVLARGKSASPGIAVGQVLTDSAAVEDAALEGRAVILARPTTDPDDVPAMAVAAAVITEIGGSTSHAAVVCREMGIPCIVGLGVGTLASLDGRLVTVDASAGVIYQGRIELARPGGEVAEVRMIRSWREEASPG